MLDDSTPLRELEDSTLVRQGAVRLLRLVQLATEIAAATTLDTLLKTITEGLTRLLLATRTTIYVYDPKTNEIWSKVADTLEIREIRLPVGKGIAGKTAENRQLMNIPDVKNSPWFAADIDKKTGFVTRSILSAPMLNLKKELIGVVEVLNKRAGSFSEEDEELLRLFAGYAGVAIEGALLAEQMVRRERLAAVGNMAGTIVHDVKNVLSVVNGYLDMIQPSERDRDLVGVIQGEIDKIVDLTSEVLEFARGGEVQLQAKRVDVDQAIAEILRVLEREFQIAGVNLVFDQGKAGPAKLDLRRFRRVIMNLAQNARKVVPRGGTLTVRTRRDNRRVVIELEDDGPGIPAEIRGKIFTPFTAAGEHGGTGLGLAIARSIVEAHSGKITARDRQPHGTVFQIEVPGDDVGSGLHSVAREMPPLGT